jgi:tape measure domain-containing protein
MADLNLKLVISATNDGAIRSVNQVEQSVRGVGKSARETIADLAHISGAILLWQQFAGSPAAVVSALARVSDEMRGVEARVKLSSASLLEFTGNMAAIRATAQAAGTDVASVAALFNRLATPLKDMGASANETIGAVAAVGNALRISGASASESSAAMLQFAQAMGSGVLRGEELNSILENAPRLAQAIATGLGVTVGELKKLGEQGALTSAQVFRAVQSQQNDLAEEAARLPQTVGMAWTNLGEGVKKYAGDVDKAYGATAAMVNVMNAMATNLPAIAAGLGDAALIAGTALIANRTAALARLVGGRLADAEATGYQARANLAHAETALVAAQAQRQAALTELEAIAVRRTYATTTELATLANEQMAASARLAAANVAVGAASQAAATAGAAASVTLLGRAMGVAATAGRGLLAVLGGWPGLVLTALTAGVLAWQHYAGAAKQTAEESGQSLAKMTADFAAFSAKRGPGEAAEAFADLKGKAAAARDQLASPLFRNSAEGRALAADLAEADKAIERFDNRVRKFNDSHAKERGLLGLDKLKLDSGGLVDNDMLQKLNAFGTLYKDSINGAIGDNNRLKANAAEVKAALAQLLAQAKTPAEFSGLVGRLAEAIKASPKDAGLKSALENAIEGRTQAEMKALSAMVSGMEARAQRTQAFFARSANVLLGQFNQTTALARVAAEMASDTARISRLDTGSRNAEAAVAQQGAALQVAALEQVAARKRDLNAEQKKDALAAARDEIDAARMTQSERLALISADVAKGRISEAQAADQRTALARETAGKIAAARASESQAAVDAARKLREVDAETARQRAAIAEGLYKTLQGKAAEALGQYRQYAQQVIALDKAIQNNRLDTAAAIQALLRQNMTPEEQGRSLAGEMQELRDAADRADRSGKNDQALELLNRQKGVAQQIGNLRGAGLDPEAQVAAGVGELERIGAQSEAIMARQRAAAQQAASTQLASYNDLTKALESLGQQITALNEQAAIKIKPEIDKASLDGAIAAVQQAFSGVTVPVRVQAVGLPAGDSAPVTDVSRAYGGLLPGHAPHDRADNMLYWGTPGEWVIQRPAARYYGAAFLAALNAMRLPKFALGGQIGGSAINRLRVPSLTPAPSPLGRGEGGGSLTLDFGELGKVHAQAGQNTQREIERVFTRAALARGRR